MCGWYASLAELLHNGLLKVEIQVSGTTGPIDRLVQGKLGLERFGTGFVDFVTAAADPRANGDE
jgi:hypothetical protein